MVRQAMDSATMYLRDYDICVEGGEKSVCRGDSGGPLVCEGKYIPGLSSLGVPGVPWHTQILTDQLTLFQPGGTDYAHLIATDTPGFSDLPTALL